MKQFTYNSHGLKHFLFSFKIHLFMYELERIFPFKINLLISISKIFSIAIQWNYKLFLRSQRKALIHMSACQDYSLLKQYVASFLIVKQILLTSIIIFKFRVIEGNYVHNRDIMSNQSLSIVVLLKRASFKLYFQPPLPDCFSV